MRVLFACDFHLKYSVNHALALARAGTDVSLICRDHAFEFGGSEDERREFLGQLNGVPIQVLPGRMSSPSSARHVIRLRRWVRRWKPDVIQTHENTDPRLLAIVSRIPRVTTVHDPVPHPGQLKLSRVEDFVRHWWIAHADAVVVHGASLADELPSWAQRRRVVVLPHGAPVRDQPASVPKARTVLLFGRLEPYKGIDVLVQAMERVWARRPEVRLIVAGTGPEAALLKTDTRIELRERYIPETELDSLFSEATVAVLPYVQASQSGVGAQSLGRGVPTIVSDTGALRDIAVDSTFLVPPGDDAALATSILRHIDHDAALRDRVLEFARDRISWDASARGALELYESLARGRL